MNDSLKQHQDSLNEVLDQARLSQSLSQSRRQRRSRKRQQRRMTALTLLAVLLVAWPVQMLASSLGVAQTPTRQSKTSETKTVSASVPALDALTGQPVQSAKSGLDRQRRQARKNKASKRQRSIKAGVQVPYAATIDAAARRWNVDRMLMRGLIRQESGFDAGAGSHVGAQGLGQLMPATAQGLGVNNAFDPVQNLDGTAHYLSLMIAQTGSVALGLAAYNAGPGAVKRYGGIPPYAETQHYVKAVMSNWRAYQRSGGTKISK